MSFNSRSTNNCGNLMYQGGALKGVRHRSYSASEANDNELRSSKANSNVNFGMNRSNNSGTAHQNNKGRFGWVRRFIQSNKLNTTHTNHRHKRHSSSNKMTSPSSDTEADMCYNDTDIDGTTSGYLGVDLNSMYNFESHNDNVSTKPLVSRSNSSKLTSKPTNASEIETINNNQEYDRYTLSTLGGNSQVTSRNSSLYVNNPRNGFALDMYSLNENRSDASIGTNNNKLVITDYSNEMSYDNSTRQSTKSVMPMSVFDNGNASIPGTPETSIASVSLFPASTYSNNYTYSNPVQNSYNQSLAINGNNHSHYTRSIATSTLNNNDSSSIITLASSTRNLLNRSKSARRSVETFNSSTIGIPPSSIFERLNQTYGSSASTNNNPNSNFTGNTNNIINEDSNIETVSNVGDENEITELANDDLYSFNNSLRTHYSIHNRPANDNNSFKSHKTGKLSVKSVNSIND